MLVLALLLLVAAGFVFWLGLYYKGYDVWFRPPEVPFIGIGKRVPDTLGLRAIVTDNVYDDDFFGFRWYPHMSEVRFTVGNSGDRPITKLDLKVTTDRLISHVGKIVDVPGCEFYPVATGNGAGASIISLGSEEGDVPVIPVRNGAVIPTYRLVCEMVPGQTSYEFILATVTLNPPEKQPPLFAPRLKPREVLMEATYQIGGKEFTKSETVNLQ